YLGKLCKVVGSVNENAWRCSIATLGDVSSWCSSVGHGPGAHTITRTRNEFCSGRSRDVGSSAGVYTGGAFWIAWWTCAMSSVASCPCFGEEPVPEPIVVQESESGHLGGCTPGA